MKNSRNHHGAYFRTLIEKIRKLKHNKYNYNYEDILLLISKGKEFEQ